MSNTFTPVTPPTGSAYAVGHALRVAQVERIRQALNVFGYIGGIWDLGGSEDVGIMQGSPVDWYPVRKAQPYELNGDELGGLTLQVIVTSKLGVAGSPATMQWRLRNTTDGSNAAIGDAHSETEATTQTKTVTLASGVKSYRLEVTGSDAGVEALCWGYLRFRRVPA